MRIWRRRWELVWWSFGLAGLLLLLASTGAAAEPAGDAGLLDEILAAQAEIEQLSGSLDYEVHNLDDAGGQVNRQLIQAKVRYPDKYFICIIPIVEGEPDPVVREWHVSDGSTYWHALKDFPNVPPDVDPPKAVDPTRDDDLASYVRLLRLERDELDKKFSITVQPQLAEADRQHPEAQRALILQPKGGNLAKHIERLQIQLDAAHRTVAVLITGPKKNKLTVIRAKDLDYTTPLADDVFVWK